MNLQNRKIKMFRCYRDPAIEATAKNAFLIGDAQCPILEAEITQIGVWAKTKRGREHIIPYANIENIMLMEDTQSEDDKPKRGRPVGS